MSQNDTQKFAIYVAIGAIGIIALFVFLPAAKFDFTNWDDNLLVTNNPAIRDLSISGILKLFASFSLNHYHPFTTLSYAIDYELFGLSPYHFHLINILLHVFNSMLVVVLSRAILKSHPAAFIAGLLFAIHPLRVESVVWIAERKDVLSAFFILLSFAFYTGYRQTNSRKLYILTILSFISALLSKAMAVTLPILFILYDYYVDGYIERKKLQEKIPLFLLSFLFGVIAIIAQYSTGVSSKDPSFDILKSCFLVPYGLLFYGLKYINPVHLSPVYPYPETIGAEYSFLFWLSPFFVAVIAYGFYRYFRHNRLITFAVLFYIISILPVLQFIPVGRAIAADRFSYIPLIGLMLITGQGVYSFWMSLKTRPWLRILFLIVSLGALYGMLSITQRQVSVWQTSITLWSRVVQDNPLYAEGYNNLGLSLAEREEFIEALKNFNEAIVLDSTDAEYFYNRGLLYLQTKRWDDAVKDFSRMISLSPQDVSGYVLRGDAYLGEKSYSESIADYTRILEFQPLVHNVRLKRAQAKFGIGDSSGALEDLDLLYSTGVPLDSILAKGLPNRYQLKPDSAILRYNIKSSAVQ